MSIVLERQRGLVPTMGGSTYVKPSEMDWKPTRFEKVSIKVLYEDPERGEMTCLLKLEPGAYIPFHKHPEIEQTLVLEGSIEDHDGIATAGDYIWRKPGSLHDKQVAWRRSAVRGVSQTEPLLLRGERNRRFLGPIAADSGDVLHRILVACFVAEALRLAESSKWPGAPCSTAQSLMPFQRADQALA